MGKYASVADLPPQVTDVLSAPLQHMYLDSYNAAWDSTSDVTTAQLTAWTTVAPKLSEKPTKAWGYWTELEPTLEFDEQDSAWIQAMPIGKYNHPRYGEIDITPERVKRFVANINNNVRGQQLDIDYEHKENPAEGGRAAGWVLEAEDRGQDGAWIHVKWTPRAMQALKDGEYRYFSPEIADEWEHPQTGVAHLDVMFGGALTNRPFLKGILPINLSELFDDGSKKEEKPPEGGNVNELLKKLIPVLGLKEDASEQDALDAVNKLAEPVKKEIAAQKFAEQFPEEAARLKSLEEENKKTATAAKLSEWAKNDESKKGIPPAVSEPIAKFRVQLSDELATQFDAILDETVKVGLVDFSEGGNTNGEKTGKENNTSGAAKFDEAIEKYQEENKEASYADAMRAVAKKEPALYRAWVNSAQPVGVGSEGGE